MQEGGKNKGYVLCANSFLDDIISVLQEAAYSEIPAKATSKAQAFDTVDEAISSGLFPRSA